MSDSLRFLTKNEWQWVNHSGCSPKMSEWANYLLFWANHSFLRKLKSEFPVLTFWCLPCNLHSFNCTFCRVGTLLFCSFTLHTSLIVKRDCEQFAHAALYKRATMSDSLRLLFTKERHGQIALVALWKRAMLLIHSWFQWNTCKKQMVGLKKLYFCMFLLFFKEQLEQSAAVTLYKRVAVTPVTVSD